VLRVVAGLDGAAALDFGGLERWRLAVEDEDDSIPKSAISRVVR
jgi:hypothetical protein